MIANKYFFHVITYKIKQNHKRAVFMNMSMIAKRDMISYKQVNIKWIKFF